MALDDQAHVEAVALIRRQHQLLAEVAGGGLPTSLAVRAVELDVASRQFLHEHHPDPGVYVAALRAGGNTVSAAMVDQFEEAHRDRQLGGDAASTSGGEQ